MTNNFLYAMLLRQIAQSTPQLSSTATIHTGRSTLSVNSQRQHKRKRKNKRKRETKQILIPDTVYKNNTRGQKKSRHVYSCMDGAHSFM